MDAPTIIAVGGIFVQVLSILVTGGVAVYVARLNANVKRVATEVEKVHVAVNSERTAMIAEVKALVGEKGKLEGAAEERVRADDAAANKPTQ